MSLGETEKDLAREQEARAPGGEGTRRAGNVREKARRARTRVRGRAHLLALGAPPSPPFHAHAPPAALAPQPPQPPREVSDRLSSRKGRAVGGVERWRRPLFW